MLNIVIVVAKEYYDLILQDYGYIGNFKDLIIEKKQQIQSEKENDSEGIDIKETFKS